MLTEHTTFANGRARHCVSQEFQLTGSQTLLSDTLRSCERYLTMVSPRHCIISLNFEDVENVL